jgi:16S rRNA (guanine966-N2)-methyltransferase
MLQVHSGTFKGRKLYVPKGINVRPTTARIKQSIFDSLSDFNKKTVLDCFAGSGALGIESLSRGAVECVFIEKDINTVKLILKNLENCGISLNYNIMNLDYKKALNILEINNQLFDIIFIDPPFEIYNKLKAESLISDFAKVLSKQGTIIIEHIMPIISVSDKLCISVKKYGSYYVSFVNNKI